MRTGGMSSRTGRRGKSGRTAAGIFPLFCEFRAGKIDFFRMGGIIVVMNGTGRTRRGAAGRKIAMLGILSGLGLAAFMLESLIPMPFLPGAKLGFANIFSMLALLLYGLPEALLVVTARTFLGSLFAGNLSMLLYSLTAGLVSACLSRLLLAALPRVSLLCVSVAAAVVHNLVQLLVYCTLTGTALLFVYSPYLCLTGAGAGVAVGIAVTCTVKALPARLFARHSLPKEDIT